MFNYKRMKLLREGLENYKSISLIYKNQLLRIVHFLKLERVRVDEEPIQILIRYLDKKDEEAKETAEREKIEKIVLDLLARQKGKK